MKKLLIILVAVSMNVFALTPNRAESVLVKEIRQTINLMPVIGPSGPTVRTRLQVEVVSGGCTRAEDFRVVVLKRGSDQELTIVRTKPDFCEAVLHPVTIELETTALTPADQDNVKVMNPLLVNIQRVY